MNLKEGRERTVLRMVAQGMRSKDIANRLCIAEITVRKILEKVMKREGLTNRVQLAVDYYKTYGDVSWGNIRLITKSQSYFRLCNKR